MTTWVAKKIIIISEYLKIDSIIRRHFETNWRRNFVYYKGNLDKTIHHTSALKSLLVKLKIDFCF